MKSKLIILLLLVCILPVAYSQYERGEKSYFFYTDAQIKENVELNRHNSCQILRFEYDSFALGTDYGFYSEHKDIHLISTGTVKLIDDVLYCYDKELNRTYKFRQIDFYTLEALNHTAVFVQGTKLYLHHYLTWSGQQYSAFYHPDGLIKSDYWKTGVRNGIYNYDDVDNKIGLYYYRDNIPADSISLDELYRDSESIAKEIFFVERYGNEYDLSRYYHNDLDLKLFRYMYLLAKGDKIISVGGSSGNLRHLKLAIYEEDFYFKDINDKYEFTLSSKNDGLLIVKSFKSTFPNEVPIFNVGDTLKLSK